MDHKDIVALAKIKPSDRIARHSVYAAVYTPTNTMKSSKAKTRRASRRKSILFGVWLSPAEKRRLLDLASKTGVDQSKLVRRGLRFLFDAFDRGQLELGFPDTVRPESSLGANRFESKA